MQLSRAIEELKRTLGSTVMMSLGGVGVRVDEVRIEGGPLASVCDLMVEMCRVQGYATHEKELGSALKLSRLGICRERWACRWRT